MNIVNDIKNLFNNRLGFALPLVGIPVLLFALFRRAKRKSEYKRRARKAARTRAKNRGGAKRKSTGGRNYKRKTSSNRAKRRAVNKGLMKAKRVRSIKAKINSGKSLNELEKKFKKNNPQYSWAK